MLNVISNSVSDQFYWLHRQSSQHLACLSVLLTKHCVELLRVKVPLPPGSLVTLGLGIVCMVELWFCPKRVQHSQHAPLMLKKEKTVRLLHARNMSV